MQNKCQRLLSVGIPVEKGTVFSHYHDDRMLHILPGEIFGIKPRSPDHPGFLQPAARPEASVNLVLTRGQLPILPPGRRPDGNDLMPASRDQYRSIPAAKRLRHRGVSRLATAKISKKAIWEKIFKVFPAFAKNLCNVLRNVDKSEWPLIWPPLLLVHDFENDSFVTERVT